MTNYRLEPLCFVRKFRLRRGQTSPRYREQRNAVPNMSRRAFVAVPAGLALGGVSMAVAQPSLSALAALLTDIPGWQADKPNTMSMSQGGITVSYAARDYQQGEKRLVAMLGRTGIEQQTSMVAGDRQGDFSMEVNGASLRSRTVRGFRVFTAYEAEDKDGMVLVYLVANAASTFVLQFDGITIDEALTLAQRFDWAAMQRAVGGR